MPVPDPVLRPSGRALAWLASLASIAVLAAACGASPGPTPSAPASDPGSPPASGDGASAGPDISADPLDPSPSLPSYRPPPQPSIALGAPGLVLHVPVLMYHRIIPPAQAGDSLPGLVVPPDLFAAQMDGLAKAGWQTITAARLAADLAAGTRPPPRTIVITFDDGYDDGYTYALPILRAHGFVATFYVIAGRIGNAPGPLEALTPGHVRALAEAGMEIGNHTYNHADLPLLAPALLRYQLVAASARIEQLVGSPPLSLAYPFGRWDSAVAGEVRAAGMQLALTTVEGAQESWPTRFETPRIRIGPWTTPAELLALVRRFSP